jgi:hypothetical protein
MKKTSNIFNTVLKRKTTKLNNEFEMYISKMQPYEVSVFYSDLDSSYKFYSSKYFDENKFKSIALKNYNVDLDIQEVKDEVYESIYKYAHIYIYLHTLIEFIKNNDIDLGDVNEDD